MKKIITTIMLSGAFYCANAQATRPDEPTGSAANPPTYQDKNGKITEVDKGNTGHKGFSDKSKAEGGTGHKEKSKQEGNSKNTTNGNTTPMDATTPKQ